MEKANIIEAINKFGVENFDVEKDDIGTFYNSGYNHPIEVSVNGEKAKCNGLELIKNNFDEDVLCLVAPEVAGVYFGDVCYRLEFDLTMVHEFSIISRD